MVIKKEISLCAFEPWGDACYRYEQLTNDELEKLEEMLMDIYPNGIDETTLNDIFWFDFPTLCEWLGIDLNFETDEIIR